MKNLSLNEFFICVSNKTLHNKISSEIFMFLYNISLHNAFIKNKNLYFSSNNVLYYKLNR